MARSSAPTLHRVSDCGVMCRSPWREGSNEIRSDVVFRTSGSDGVSENTSTDFPGAVGSVDGALGLASIRFRTSSRSGASIDAIALLPTYGTDPFVDLLSVACPR